MESLTRTRVSTLAPEDALEHLDSHTDGLSNQEADLRREQFGDNKLREAKKTTVWEILLPQFLDPIVAMLAVAALISVGFQEYVDAIAIVVVIIINGIIGFVTEWRAIQAMEALRELGGQTATVRRSGERQEVDATELVPGDIVTISAGDLISADMRLIEANKLQANESALTGESVPVSKTHDALEAESDLAETNNMLFKGTSVTRGSGEAVVSSTGMDTEIGHISELVEGAEQEETPLEQRLNKLGRSLIWVTTGIAVVIAVAGWLAGRDLFLIVQTAVALAVAAIPEGLPIIATIALARGTRRMAERNALINELSAVETLGSTNVICTDKTGTLTANRMTVTRIGLAKGDVKHEGGHFYWASEVIGDVAQAGEEGALDVEGEVGGEDSSEDSPLLMALRIGVLCNNAELSAAQTDHAEQGGTQEDTQNEDTQNNAQNQEDDMAAGIGDPLELALLAAGRSAYLQRDSLLETFPEVYEDAFDSDSKRMATVHQRDSDYFVALKGAPEVMLELSQHVQIGSEKEDLSSSAKDDWRERNKRLAEAGLRVIAVAYKITDSQEDAQQNPYEGATLAGFIAMEDPPRDDVRPAIDACQEAGIQVVMVTGDQAITAKNISVAVGLAQEEADVVMGSELAELDSLSPDERQRLQDTQIFARVSPEQKLNLITLHQDAGNIVAMTGDGVNDAPALKKADIGVAMGKRGTQVAQQAAKMVLQDDAFQTIVTAIAYGRTIFNNIRKFTVYLLSGNVGQILIIAPAVLVSDTLPLLPLQILYLNLVNDVFPALALGVGEGSDNVMQNKPKDPQEPILPSSQWWAIVAYGAVIAASVLVAFTLTVRRSDADTATTTAFLTVSLARLWHVFNMRDPRSGFISNEISRNRYVWIALAICIALLAAAAFIPGLSAVLSVSLPDATGWGIIFGCSLLPLILGQLYKLWQR